MTEVGDRVRVQSRKLGQAVREGVVTEVVPTSTPTVTGPAGLLTKLTHVS